jgi:nucleotide-binding universal stress UspA family protein
MKKGSEPASGIQGNPSRCFQKANFSRQPAETVRFPKPVTNEPAADSRRTTMNHKILIALDASDDAAKCANYVAGVVSRQVSVTLVHIFPKVPAVNLGMDTLLTNHFPPFSERIKELETWVEQERIALERALQRAKTVLVEAGLEPRNIDIKLLDQKEGVARDILELIREGGYQTVVVGRRGLSATEAFFMGSVSNKIVQHAKGCTVWVVE